MNKKTLLFTVVLILVIGLSALFFKKDSLQQQNKPFILCTTSIIGDTIQQIVGDTAQVYCLMGPGIDPHLYKAREGDLHRLANAAIIFYNGLHLEGKMAHVLHQMNHYTPSIALSDALSTTSLLQTEVDGIYDPHIWHDVILWVEIVKYATACLCKQWPEHADIYNQNAQVACNQLSDLDQYVRKQLSTIDASKRILVTAHDAFSYFGKRYGMEVVGLQGVSTDAEISTGAIQDLVAYLVDKQIHAIFIESSIPKRSIQAVHNAAAARNWYVTIGQELYSDALGDADSDAHTYYAMIRHNVDAIVQALTA